MVPTNGGVTIEEVLTLVKQLSPVDQARLIEQIALEIEQALVAKRPGVSLLGLVKDLGPAPSTDEIDAARREAWATFSSDDR